MIMPTNLVLPHRTSDQPLVLQRAYRTDETGMRVPSHMYTSLYICVLMLYISNTAFHSLAPSLPLPCSSISYHVEKVTIRFEFPSTATSCPNMLDPIQGEVDIYRQHVLEAILNPAEENQPIDYSLQTKIAIRKEAARQVGFC
eukprot:TRINITY_DN1636_c0_g1_i2.p1 TRINITY_DN1636_c0_g1~~TRINITY_DN1636_c0_g1_i2.p1  ORF type:complete len:143 (-),score=7.25 TRINITY_DN1636_c0_g1_i2:256-684(-)